MTILELGELAAWLAAGLLLGAVYIRLIGRSVAELLEAGSAARAAGWFLLRIGLAALALWGAATQGALPLLSMLLGYLVARTLVVRAVRRADIGS